MVCSAIVPVLNGREDGYSYRFGDFTSLVPWVSEGLTRPTHRLKQEKSPLMKLRMIERTTLKGQGNLPRTTVGDREIKAGSSLTRDLIMYCSLACLKVQEKSSPQKRSQIEKAMRSGQLSHLVKGIKKERTKTFDNQRGKKKEKSTTPAEAPVLMIEACIRNNVSKGRVHMDSGSSYEVIYEHCFLKLKPSIQASKLDSHVPLVRFSWKKSWAIREVLLEITIGNALLTKSETLNFFIIRSNSPYNMLLGRTAMQKMGMVVSMIHEAVKFHTT
nr:reverse transcriptase domain-containing protein [Tanacetum cinerariifolium]